jgi:hypothetical protein
MHAPARMDQNMAQPQTQPYPPKLCELLEQATLDDRDCVADLRRGLGEHPDVLDLLPDVLRHIQQSFVELAAQNLGSPEPITGVTSRLRAQLRAVATTALEQLLAARVEVCWLDVDACAADLEHRRRSEPGDAATVRDAQQLDRARARHRVALQVYATARTLLQQVRPTL